MTKRIDTKFGLYCDELKIFEADVIADVSETRVDVLSALIPWTNALGKVTHIDAVNMLSLSTMSELKEHLRNEFKALAARDAVEAWDDGPSVA